jgi:hypothetical protein
MSFQVGSAAALHPPTSMKAWAGAATPPRAQTRPERAGGRWGRCPRPPRRRRAPPAPVLVPGRLHARLAEPRRAVVAHAVGRYGRGSRHGGPGPRPGRISARRALEVPFGGYSRPDCRCRGACVRVGEQARARARLACCTRWIILRSPAWGAGSRGARRCRPLSPRRAPAGSPS